MLLIDGTNTLIRLKTAACTSDNKHLMFMRMLLKMARKFNDYQIAVAWDIAPSKYRLELYPQYKRYEYIFAGDYGMMKAHNKLLNELHEQVLPTSGVMSVVCEQVEADDIIATLVAQPEYAAEQKVIISTDRDYLQLIDDNCAVYDPVQDKRTDAADMLAHYGVADMAMARKLYLIEKCLIGDTSDNIPGIKGVGEAAARRILQSCVSGTYLAADAEVLKAHKDELDLYRRLISLALLPESDKGAIQARVERAQGVVRRLANDEAVGDEVAELYGLRALGGDLSRLRGWCS